MNIKNKCITSFLLLLSFSCFGQDLRIFNHELDLEEVTESEALDQFKASEDYKFITIGKELHSLVFEIEDQIFKYNSYVLKADSIKSDCYKLNQIGLSSERLEITKYNFDRLKSKSEELIEYFRIKLGEPTKKEVITTNFWNENDPTNGEKIMMAVWVKDDVKLKIIFSLTGNEKHNSYAYELRISKFKDYLGNLKLQPWWDGY